MKKIYIFLILTLGIHLFFLSRLQFTAWPEMLSFPYMIDKGFLIYKDFHHVYQPLLTFILFIYYKFAGYSPESLRIFTWGMILIIDLLLYVVSKQLFKNKWVQLVPVALYAILQPLFEGNMLWFDIAMTVPLLLSIYFVFRWSSDGKKADIFLTGLFLAAAFLIKQQAALTIIPFLVYFRVKKIRLRDFVTFLIGGLIPILILISYLIIRNDLKDYFFWTFELPLYWLPHFPGYKILPAKKELLVILIAAVTPLPALFFALKKRIDSKLVLIYGLFLTLLISAFPRFSFFHLQPFFAFFVLAFSYLFELNKKIYITLATLALLYVINYRWKFILPEFNSNIRFYGKDEINLTQYISSVTGPNDKIYLLGPGSAIYVYAGRVPPKPWIENYVWHFEIPGLQEKVIAGWETDPPKIIFWISASSGNWFDLGVYQPEKIADWINKNYIKKEETKSGIGVWYKIK